MADRIQSSLFRYHLLINSFKIEVFDPKLRLCSEIKTGLGFLAIAYQFINQLCQPTPVFSSSAPVYKGDGDRERKKGRGRRKKGWLLIIIYPS